MTNRFITNETCFFFVVAIKQLLISPLFHGALVCNNLMCLFSFYEYSLVCKTRVSLRRNVVKMALKMKDLTSSDKNL